MNISRGLLRLWLVLSLGWLAFGGYQAYSYHRAWKSGFAAATATTGARESERDLLIQNYLFDAKARHDAMVKGSGMSVPSFDEGQVRAEAFTNIVSMQEQGEQKKAEDLMYQTAFDSRNSRDSFLPFIPAVPVGLALLFFAIVWVTRGFRKT